MAATKSKQKIVLASARDAKTARRQGFWRGLEEGFGGPLLLACRLRDFHPLVLAVLEDDEEKSSDTGREISRAVSRATTHVMEKHGLGSVATRRKRLDDSGKMQDVFVRIVGPRQTFHGEPQK